MISTRISVVIALTGLAACTGANAPVEKSGTETFDARYKLLGNRLTSGVTFIYAMRVRPEGDLTGVCGLVAIVGEGRNTRNSFLRAIPRLSLNSGDARIVQDFSFLAGPLEFPDLDSVSLNGRTTNCVTTQTPWSDDFRYRTELRLDSPRKVWLEG